MLASIVIELSEALATRKVPYPVVYGPETMEQARSSRPRIVIERARGVEEPVSAPLHQAAQTTTTSPTKSVVMRRQQAAVCRVYAQSTVSSAGAADHERVADQVVEQVLVALRSIVGARRNTWTIGSGHFLAVEELVGLGAELWSGVVYEQAFSVDRGVTDSAYAGESTAAKGTAPEASVATAGGAHGFGVGVTLDTSDSPGTSETIPGASTR